MIFGSVFPSGTRPCHISPIFPQRQRGGISIFILYAEKNRLTVQAREPVTSGSVNVCAVQFDFSEDWEGLAKTACFRAGGKTVSVPLGADGGCVVPWEVLQDSGRLLLAGVCGRGAEGVVLPTVWASLGTVLEGTAAGEPARPPESGGTEEGFGDHRLLTGREAAGQHPISAVAGLREELARIPAPAEALSNLELEELLK